MANDLLEKAPQGAWQAYKRLLEYYKRYWIAFLVALVGFAIFAASQAAFAELMRYMVESVEQNDAEARYLVPIMVLALFMSRGLGFFLGNYGVAHMARRTVHDLRVEIFDQLLVLPAAYYHRHSSGALLSKLTFNVEQITNAATQALKILVREGLTVIALLIFLIYLNGQLTLVFLLVGPLIGLVVNKASKRFRTISKNLQNSMGDVTASASEAIRGYEVVRMFGGQAQEKNRFFKASNSNRQQAMKLAMAESVSTPLVQMIVATAMALLIFLAMQPEIVESMSAGEFIAFITAAGMLTKPLRSLTEVNSILQQGIAAAQSLFDMLDEQPELDVEINPKALPEGDICYSNLCFSYSNTPVLKNINLTLPRGKVVALVGRSGSGKSTLVNMLLRFYDPQEGAISVGGVDVQTVSRAQLRSQIALVNQQVICLMEVLRKILLMAACSEPVLRLFPSQLKRLESMSSVIVWNMACILKLESRACFFQGGSVKELL